ncbi:hypothetical protein HH214_08680 [Mucilaginibacter robiniae]|uniref:Uncharacterized protein n=1 Tax=Mucilaginibacter robiniae TaxID=2728022 RepID=A0A7L5E2T2_9SPHI|nr:hypothetical protein [Mucilaginibacter robiniae]QJD95944.1 hypothetical protein HH214_08680 [Mucilaginibacter robiniae]
MWKRIHSNRDPRDTLQSEIRKEFRPYFDRAVQRFKKMVSRKPKWTFAFMAALLFGSVILSFTHALQPYPATRKSTTEATQVSEGFNQLMGKTLKLRHMITLKGFIDSLSAKTHLTATDSAGLSQALDSLAVLQKSLFDQRHEH